jgi:phospholipid/cholesterol/gamma-HCH transport system substrate-binding protein
VSAPARRRNLRLASFLVGAAACAALLVWFSRRPLLLGGEHDYRARFSDVAGLNVGDEVRYGGLRVGSVSDIRIDSTNPASVVVRFRVRRDTPVRTDTRASVTQVGLLGQPYLGLRPGSAGAAPLPDGAMLPSENSPSVQETMRRLVIALDRADTLFAALGALADVSPLERIDLTMARADTLLRTASASSERVFARLDIAATRLADVLERTERVVSVVDTSVRTAGPQIASTQREAAAALSEVRALVVELRDAMDEGGGVDALVRNLAVASDNFARLSARLERDPSSVLKRRALPAKPVGPALRD